MDAIERQTAVFRKRERKLVTWIACVCFGLLALALGKEAVADEAFEDYVQGVNVQVCRPAVKQPLSGKLMSDCRAQGKYTPHKVEAEVQDDQGRVYIAEVDATLVVKCGEKYCRTIENRDGTPMGTMMGSSKPGDYAVEVGWYLSYDGSGNATAYRETVGPLHHQPAFVYNCAEYNECTDKVTVNNW